MSSREWVTDSELLRSIDFENPQPEDVPVLIALFDDHSEEICQQAYRALAKIGDPAIPALVDKLRPGFERQDFVVRSRTRRALGRMGPSAVPALIEVLEDDKYDQISVVHTLGAIRPTTEEAVKALISIIDEDGAGLVALHVLGRRIHTHHPESQAAVPIILQFLRHEDSKVRREAAISLWFIDRETATDLGMRESPFLTVPDFPPFREDSELLRGIDFDDPEPEDVPPLIRLFEDHSHEVFLRASDALVTIGKPAVAPLVEAMQKDKPVVMRVRAADVLQRLGSPAVPAMAEAIHDAHYDFLKLIYVVGRIRPVTAEAVDLLLGVVDEFDVITSQDALHTLRWLGCEGRDAVPGLLDLLEHDDDRIRSSAARALWHIDRDAAHDAGLEGPSGRSALRRNNS